jgi:hypothetical protein
MRTSSSCWLEVTVRSQIVASAVLVLVTLTGCNENQEACNNLAGNGNYSPVEEGGNVYCENAWSGDRFLLS